MFELFDLPQPIHPELLSRALLAEPAVIGHFRIRGFPSGSIAPQICRSRIAGTAVTLSLPGADSALLHHVVGMLRPGDVLVIDRLGDRHHACLGGGVALALMKVGVAGAIVDGAVADPEELEMHKLPIWARGYSAMTTRLYGVGGAFNCPVSIGGAVVMPGDLVIADRGGIVFLPPDQAESSITRAIAMMEAEQQGMALLSPDRPLGSLTGASEMVERALAK